MSQGPESGADARSDAVRQVFEVRYHDLPYRYEVEPINKACVKVRAYFCDGGTTRLRIGENVKVGTLMIEGTIKWDGCADIQIGEWHPDGERRGLNKEKHEPREDGCGFTHFCGPQQIAELATAMQRMYEAAGRYLETRPDWLVWSTEAHP